MPADRDDTPTLTRVAPHVAYRVVRANVTNLAGRSPDPAGLPVPACPEWTVRDLVAHLTGNCASVLGEPADPPGTGLADLVARWADIGPRVEHLAEHTDLPIGRLLMDAFTHELDLRAALGLDTIDDHPAYQPSFDVVIGGLSWSIQAHGLPALTLACDGAAWVAGSGRPAATLTAPRYHLYRSLTGRRTPAQVAALTWSADPTPWLPAFYWGPFQPPGAPTGP